MCYANIYAEGQGRADRAGGGSSRKKPGLILRLKHSLAAFIAAGVFAGSCIAATPALAAVNDHIVDNTVSPAGIQLNVFDYWVLSEDENYPNNTLNSQIANSGINYGHDLKFTNRSIGTGDNGSKSSINAWTGRQTSTSKGGPRTGIVANKLGEDGYPQTLANQLNGVNSYTFGQSLSYLFDASNSDYKRAYTNVKGLFQLDEDGYFVYDSRSNFAEFDSKANSFKVYDAPAVSSSSAVADQSTGQFFPFNTGQQVFKESGNTLQSSADSASAFLNQFFGLSMKATFMQPTGGQANGKDMVFNFSGDDDVWVFIDGVLVGDVGGLHDRSTLSINFANGSVTVKGGGSYNTSSTNTPTYTNTTIKAMFGAAGVDTSTGFSGNTFANGTYHSISFYYLERGAGNSNLRLQTNLISVPTSEIKKVNQDGEAVAGATFQLYAADESYTQGDLVASGTTAADGTLQLNTTNGIPINFAQLYDGGRGTTNYILRETDAPSGYRKAKDAHIKYVAAANGAEGYLKVENTWESGAWAAPHGSITLDTTTLPTAHGDTTINLDDGGTVYAVVLHRTSTDAGLEESDWHAVSGDSSTGWKLSEQVFNGSTSTEDINGLLDQYGHAFTVGSDGKYAVLLDELPGDLGRYYHFDRDAASTAQYAIAYYWRSDDGSTVTRLSDESNLTRTFAARLYLTDHKNDLVVQKRDDAGSPVDGATFSLYAESQVTSTVDGSLVLVDGARPIETGATSSDVADNNNAGALQGAYRFTGLAEGTYYLHEDVAPEGYVANGQLVKVVVDGDGVHADAGTASDGVDVFVGVGKVAKSMLQFADGTLDSTLHDIYASRMTKNDIADASWTATDSKVSLTYDANGAVFEYGATNGGTLESDLGFPIEAGWSDVRVTQNYNVGASHDDAYKDNLGEADISDLFSGSTIVRVTNDRRASLSVSKKDIVTPDGSGANVAAQANKSFQFKIKVTGAAGQTYKASVLGLDGNPLTDESGQVISGTTNFDVTFNADGILEYITGEGTRYQSLKRGEQLVIYGLPDGAEYAVEEVSVNDGDAATNLPGGGYSKPDNQTGTLSGAATATASFTNTYQATGEKTVQLSAQKALRGRAWQAGDSFMFYLDSTDATTPMPAGATSTTGANGKSIWRSEHAVAFNDVQDNITTTGEGADAVYSAPAFSFGDITYTKPGTYTYRIYESTAASAHLPGMKYSDALYEATVVVGDDGNGGITDPVVTMKKLYDDDNNAVAEADQNVENKVALLTNVFSSTTATAEISGSKTFSSTADNPLLADQFTFKITALGGYATNGGSSENYTVPAADLPMPANGIAVVTGESARTTTNADNGSFTFSNIAFNNNDHAGKTFEYRVSELAQASNTTGGITYDGTTYLVKIVVAETMAADGSKSLTATPTIINEKTDATATTTTFANSYTVTSKEADAALAGQKTIIGRDMLEGETYTFTLTPASNNPAGGVSGLSETATVTGAAQGPHTFDFGTPTFSKPGTYTFTVSETGHPQTDAGMTYDTHVSTVTYVVSDVDESGKHTGQITSIQVSYDNSSAVSPADKSVTNAVAFTNSYASTGTYTPGIDVTKTLEGRNMATGEFHFTIAGADDESAAKIAGSGFDGDKGFVNAASNDGVADTMSGKLTGLTFTQADANKTYYFDVQEAPQHTLNGVTIDVDKDQGARGITFDQNNYRVGIKVIDNNDGTLHYETTVYRVAADGTLTQQGDTIDSSDEAAGAATVNFTNTYGTTSTTVTGEPLTKELTGLAWADFDGSFDYTASKVSYAPIGGEADTSDTAKAKMPDLAAGTVTKDSDAYQPGTADPSATIKTFGVFGVNGVTFSMPGTYVYSVSETIPDDATNSNVTDASGNRVAYKDASDAQKATAGWTKNGIEYTVETATLTITVTDNATGALVSNVTASENPAGKNANFTNSYSWSGTVDATPQVTKTVTGRDSNTDFTFTLTASQDYGDKVTVNGSQIGTTAQTVTISGADGQIKNGQTSAAASFGTLTFHDEGTYTFTVDENTPADGWTKGTDAQTVTYTVSDNKQGGLSVTTANAVNFANSYAVNGQATLSFSGAKTITGREFQTGDAFSFPVEVTTGGALPTGAAGGSLGISPTSGTSESLNFGTVTFTAADLDKTFVYTFSEADTTLGGVTKDADTYTVSVTVKDAGNGGIKLVVSGGGTIGGSDTAAATVSNIDFQNSYAPSGESNAAQIQVTKDINGADAPQGGFTFELAPANGQSADHIVGLGDDGKLLVTTTAALTQDNNETLSFGDLKFTADGDYKFTITETTQAAAGWANDNTSKLVTVRVKDNLDGTYKIESITGNNPTVTNSYREATLEGATSLAGTKKLVDGANNDVPLNGRAFSFTLAAGNDATQAAVDSGYVVLPDELTKTSDANGNFNFGNIVFKDTGAERVEYQFKVTEAASTAEGVTNDADADRVITVAVTREADGTLKAEVVTGNSEALQFTNTYDASTTLGIAGTKTLENSGTEQAPDIARKYTFTLAAADGSPLNKADGWTDAPTNPNANGTGTVTFGTLSYSMADLNGVAYGADGTRSKTFTYKVTESGVVDGVTNDADAATGKTFQIKLTDDGQGELTAALVDKADGNAFAFTNTYVGNQNTKDVALATDPTTSVNGKLVGVGDTLTYTISWKNDAVDQNGVAARANVTVTDVVPAGTEFVSAENGGAQADGTVTWDLGEQDAGAIGTVTFTVKVTDDAVNVDSITNKASIKVGENDPKTTNEVSNDFPKKTVETPEAEGNVKVGDTLTYTVEWANTTGETANVIVQDVFNKGLSLKLGEIAVTGADDHEASAVGGGGVAETTATVTLKNVPAGASGTVVFKAVVNEAALTVDSITNKATIQVGDNPQVTTNTTTTPGPKTGALTVSKTVTAGEGAQIDADKAFDFTVEVEDAAGTKLSGTYSGLTFADGKATFQLKHGESKTIEGLPEGATYTVGEAAADGYTTTKTGDTGTIVADNPETEAVEQASAAFTNTYGSSVPAGKEVKVDGLFKKSFTGRTWNASDAFTFKIEATDPADAPMPEKTQVTVAGDGDGAVTEKDIDFGTINFTFDDIKDVTPAQDGTRTKTFIYDVYEVIPADADKLPGVTYDAHHATLTITLRDDGKGNLTGESAITAVTRAANGTFSNTYDTSVDYSANGGVVANKTLTGRDMTNGQFALTISNADQATVEKLGLNTASDAYVFGAAKNGVASADVSLIGGNVTFTPEDAGKTYSFDVTETRKGGTGYTNDEATRHVRIDVTYDAGAGLLTVTTTVTADGKETITSTVTSDGTQHGQAIIPFANSYAAGPGYLGGNGAVELNATKTLDGRPMTAGEFGFEVTNAKDTAEKPAVLATGSNAAAADGAAGKVTFSAIEYTSDSLYQDAANGLAMASQPDESGKVTYAYQYNVAETSGLIDGVAGVKTSFQVTVNVTDNNDGTLTVAVVYPEGSNDTLAFANSYGKTATALVNVDGSKLYDHPTGTGYNAPDIAGKFTFTLTGTDEDGNPAPLPEKTVATNDAAGNVAFGDITYTMANVFGVAEAEEPGADTATTDEAAGAEAADEGVEPLKSAERSKTYTYTVTESGEVEGVSTDGAKTFTVTVTDNGDGTLTAVKDPAAGSAFSFTNTYEPTPVELEGDSAIKGTKTLAGRELKDAEFSFRLTALTKDAPMPEQDEVRNDADGQFFFGPMTFTKPGTYEYQVSEVAGGLGGVAYDTTVYNVTVEVTDNGRGALEATTTMATAGEDGTLAPVEKVAFANSYKAKPTTLALSAAKKLTGRDLKAGEFTFELTYTADGGEHTLRATNDSDGNVMFDEMTFAQAGTYSFKIREVAGNDSTITYDATEYEATVVVEDDLKGQLVVTSVTYNDAEATPVFTNTYTEPPALEPPAPEQPKDEGKSGGLPKTDDPNAGLGAMAAVAAAGAVALVVGIVVRHKNRG